MTSQGFSAPAPTKVTPFGGRADTLGVLSSVGVLICTSSCSIVRGHLYNFIVPSCRTILPLDCLFREKDLRVTFFTCWLYLMPQVALLLLTQQHSCFRIQRNCCSGLQLFFKKQKNKTEIVNNNLTRWMWATHRHPVFWKSHGTCINE